MYKYNKGYIQICFILVIQMHYNYTYQIVIYDIREFTRGCKSFRNFYEYRGQFFMITKLKEKFNINVRITR